jgi:hypothetical protein
MQKSLEEMIGLAEGFDIRTLQERMRCYNLVKLSLELEWRH